MRSRFEFAGSFCFWVFVVLCVGFVLWKCLRFIFLRFGVLSGGRSFVAEDYFFVLFVGFVCVVWVIRGWRR